MIKNLIFPFAAIVGQERMKKALILNAINPSLSGLLIKGEKGTAKSTAARALANLLPEIEAVTDCPFNCHPQREELMCDRCLTRKTQGEILPVIKRKMRVVDLPVGATEDRVVGTLDIECALKTGEKRFEPGVLAEAHRAILYVDEVNLLADHIVDVLLDSAAMGVNVIEREGVSYSHPSYFILIGTMNPEEGELRPQLLDRFGLCVNIEGIDEPKMRIEVIKRRAEFENNPFRFIKQWENEENELNQLIVNAQRKIQGVTISHRMLELIAQIAIDMGVDGHRADIFMMKTARTIAAYHQRTEVTEDDVKEAAELVLPHRMRKKPFQDRKMPQEQLEEITQKHKEGKQQNTDSQKQKTKDNKDNKETNENQEENDENQKQPDSSSETHFEVGDPFKVKSLHLAKEKEIKNGSGRRSKSISSDKSGKYIRSVIPEGKITDVAFDATFRAAAIHQKDRKIKETHIPTTERQRLIIKSQDIREKVREKKVGNLVLFVVDSSGSMGANQRMVAAKGAVFSLLIDSYEKRDRVGMIAFKGEKAEILLPPTNNVELANKQLSELPTGGKTPLSSGLQLALEVIQKELRKDKKMACLMVLITDGKANVSLVAGVDSFEEAKVIACDIKKTGTKSLVIDTEGGFFRFKKTQELSEVLGGKYFSIEDIKAEILYNLVKTEKD